MILTSYKFIVFLIGEVIYYLSLHLFFIGILKVQKARRFMTLYSAFWIGLGIVLYFYQVPSYLTVTSSVLICIMLSLQYSKKISRNIIYSILFSFMGNVIEFAVVYSIMFISSTSLSDLLSNEYTYTVDLLMCRFLLLITSFIIFLSKDKFNISIETTHFWPVIAIFTFGSLFIFYVMAILSLHGQITSYPIIILVLSILVIFNITVYYLYDRQCKDHILHEENNRLLNYINIQKRQQEETSTYLHQLSTMKHDMKHIFTALSGLMEQKEYQKAMQIVQRNAHIICEPATVVDTVDATINTLLNSKISYAKNYNIQVICHTFISSCIHIAFDDLCIVIGNALDNAIEYLISHDVPEKRIEIKLSFDYGILSIDIFNPVCQNIEVPQDGILPSSKGSAEHGYGLSSMKKIAEKNGGIFSISCKDNIFALKITMISQ